MKTKLIFSAFVLALLFPINAFASFGTPDLKIGANTSNHVRSCSTQDGYIYTVWKEVKYRSPNIYDYNVRLNYSSNYGRTWLSSPIAVGNTFSIINDYAYPIDPEITCTENGHVYVAWQENPTALNAICFRHSSDHGVSWGAIRWFQTQVATFAILKPHISSTEDGHVYLAWQDPYGGMDFKNISFNHSNDFGATWEPSNVQLDLGTGATDCNDVEIESTQNGHVYVIWSIDSYHIWLSYSGDYGATMTTFFFPIDFGGIAYLPSISKTEDGHVYIVWIDERNGYIPDIYFNYSTDYGEWWMSEQRLDLGSAPGAARSLNPKLGSTSDGHVYAVWQDYRNNATKADIYFNYSSDFGVTWRNPDIRIDLGDASGLNDSINPVISNDNIGNVYVAFEDTRNGGTDILFNASNDYGATWYPTLLRVNTGSTTGSGAGHNPAITSDSTNHIYVAWEDSRTASPGVYFNYSPYSDPLGPIPTLSGTMFAVATLFIIMLLICIAGKTRTVSRTS